MALSAELAAAARRAAYPLRDPALYTYEALYWNLTVQGSGVQYKTYAAEDSTVNVFDQRQCVEVDTQFFFSGPPWEYETRQLAALALNTAYDTQRFNASNSLYANAVEGIGFLQVSEEMRCPAPGTAMGLKRIFSLQVR